MVGDELQAGMKGYCRLSCGTCLPSNSISGDHSVGAQPAQLLKCAGCRAAVGQLKTRSPEQVPLAEQDSLSDHTDMMTCQ